MPELTDPWSGIGSSIAGGFIGALTVVLGVWLAHTLQERVRIKTERGVAIAKLIIEVSNLRDRAAHSRSGLAGDIDLWPLRNELLVLRHLLHQLVVYEETWKFYNAVLHFRQWIRKHQPPNGNTKWPASDFDRIRAYRETLVKYADQLLEALQTSQGDESAHVQRVPQMPELPS